MAQKTFQIENSDELVSALGDSSRMYGLTPAEKYDANTFVYPITVTVNEEEKTYVVESKKENVKVEIEKAISETSSSEDTAAAKKEKAKKIGKIVGFSILGVAVVIGIILAIYFGVK